MALKVEGSKLAMTHKHDWIIIVFLGIIEGILNLIEPFHRYIGAEMMADLKYPFHKDTIPMWAVPIYALFIPIIIFALFYRQRRDIYDFHHALLGLMFSSLITGVITDSIKDAVGRPRPNFYWRCFPDNNPVFDAVGDVACTGIASDIKEGYKSFPSGHTSWSFAGLGFLAWYLSGKVRVFDRRGHIAKICIVLLPLLLAALVGISRVDDYWHHWTDVFAGALIGITVSTICYLLLFPFPFHERGWAPHAFFHMRETESANAEKSVELDLRTEAMERGTRVIDMTSYIEL